MDKLVLIPLIISAAMLLSRKPREVFILVFLPSLTLFPTYFESELVKGTPELCFWSAALIPILAVWASKNFEGYSIHWMDLVVLAYILTIFLGQWTNSDYKKAQKILFNNMMAIYFPFVMVRTFCEEKETLINMLRIMTILGSIIAIFNIWEFKMFSNYFDEFLRRIWPHYVMWDTGMVMSRWGFKRAFGPFSHPIVAGYFFSLMAPVAIWCYFHNHYRNKIIGKLVVFLNVIGIFVSLSRAPIIGFLLGLGIIYYGWSDKKAAIGSALSVVMSLMLLVAIPKFIEYTSVTRVTAKTVEQRNVAYRKEMWESYIDLVMERPYTGWGRFTIPSQKGMESIDSEYLGIALASGLIALNFYVLYLLGMLVRLFRFAHVKRHDDPWARLAWCLIAGWCCALFTQATVYSGAQTVQYLFMFGALGQILVLKGVINRVPQQTQPVYEPSLIPELRIIGHCFRFSRVV